MLLSRLVRGARSASRNSRAAAAVLSKNSHPAGPTPVTCLASGPAREAAKVPLSTAAFLPVRFYSDDKKKDDKGADSDDEKEDKNKDAKDAAVAEEEEDDGRIPADQNVLVEKLPEHHIMAIGINRTDKRNCVNTNTAELLRNAFEDFESDPDMHVAVLHGVGGNFCAGFDLEELSTFEADLANNIAATMLDRGPMGPTRLDLSKPTIAAVSGWCVAGGLELALMCDLRVVEESARLGVLCRRFGVPLIDGGTVRLPELIGLSRAMDLILTGRIVEAKEAHDIGLANRLVSTGTAYGQAMNLARELTKFPQECMRADRASAIHATFASDSIDKSLQYESENALHVITSESIAGAKRFTGGLGKQGKFNVNTKEPEEWQKEFQEMKERREKEVKDATEEKAAEEKK